MNLKFEWFYISNSILSEILSTHWVKMGKKLLIIEICYVNFVHIFGKLYGEVMNKLKLLNTLYWWKKGLRRCLAIYIPNDLKQYVAWKNPSNVSLPMREMSSRSLVWKIHSNNRRPVRSFLFNQVFKWGRISL